MADVEGLAALLLARLEAAAGDGGKEKGGGGGGVTLLKTLRYLIDMDEHLLLAHVPRMEEEARC